MIFGNGRVYGRLPEKTGTPLIEPLSRAVNGQRNKLTHYDALPEDTILRWYPGPNLEDGHDRSVEELLHIANTTERHFNAMHKAGIYIPQHHAFIGGNPNTGQPGVKSSRVIFTLVERIDGENLRGYHHHAQLGEERSINVMQCLTRSLTAYREWASQQSEILWDNSLYSQYALHLGKITLVDLDPLLAPHDTAAVHEFDNRLSDLQKLYF